MAPAKKDFDAIIQEGRERKKNEALADKIFSRNRRQSAPSKLKTPTGPSLASRVGVKKPVKPQRGARASLPGGGNVNGDWTHDLHGAVSGRRGGGLASRITAPGASRGKAMAAPAMPRAARVAAVIERKALDRDLESYAQVNIVKKPAPSSLGISIRGLAGPFCVMAQNFAPGTTAADIESAMTPVGGEMTECRIVKTSPFILVEMKFASREGGERVIQTFNDKTADGRLIKVFPKVIEESNNAPANAPNGPRAGRNAADNYVIDGSRGFDDVVAPDSGAAGRNGRDLYSDKIVAGNRRGRGFQRSRGGR